MAGMWKRLSGDTWLAWAFALLCLTLVSTFVAFASGFIHDPDDNPPSYYLAEIPKRQLVMAVSVIIPAVSAVSAVSAVAAGASIFARPRKPGRIVAAAIVLLFAVAAVWFCWAMGIDDI